MLSSRPEIHIDPQVTPGASSIPMRPYGFRAFQSSFKRDCCQAVGSGCGWLELAGSGCGWLWLAGAGWLNYTVCSLPVPLPLGGLFAPRLHTTPRHSPSIARSHLLYDVVGTMRTGAARKCTCRMQMHWDQPCPRPIFENRVEAHLPIPSRTLHRASNSKLWIMQLANVFVPDALLTKQDDFIDLIIDGATTQLIDIIIDGGRVVHRRMLSSTSSV